MENTLDYYNRNAKAFIDSSRNLEFSEHQDKFLNYIKPGAKVLDFGCGSGRDTKYFMDKGYQVDAIDGSTEFVKLAVRPGREDEKWLNLILQKKL